jgi:hypothetical protein
METSMKRKTLAITVAVILAVSLSCASCKKADDIDEPETYKVIVIVSDGVSGTPADGEYAMKAGETLNYSYSLDSGRKKLTVTLDDKEVATSGTLTVSGNHLLRAYSDDNIEYKLTVTVGTGVTGAPAAGTYYYKKDNEVPFKYALAEGYKNLSVKVNGEEIKAEGTIKMSKNYTLDASAVVRHSVVGSWNLSESYADGSVFNVVLTFSGTLTEGTVADSEGGSGTYDYADDTIDFTLVFPDVTYKYSDGDFSDENTMSGKCKRYQDEASAVSGTWKATRASTTAASLPRGSQNKGGRR